MAVDKDILEWIKRELNHITGYIEAVDKRCKECRQHCDKAREACGLRGDHEKRLRELEKAIAANFASTWKGAKLIGACTLTAALTGAVITLARWLLK